MIKMKKTITIFLLIALLGGLLPVSAFAGELQAEDEPVIEAGDTIEEVPVEVNELPAEEESSETEAEEAPGAEEDAAPEEAPAAGPEESPEEGEVPAATEEITEPEAEISEEIIGYSAGTVAILDGTDQYTSLAEAIGDADSGSTITLVADCEITEAITINGKNLTITDDGNARSIYFSNSDKDNGSGRGIIVCGKKALTITSTATGGITLVGHSADGTVYNYSNLIYASTTNGAGTVILNGVTVTGCRLSSSGALGTYKSSSYTASLYLNGCYIHDNCSRGSNGGTAVYNSGNLYLNDGTVITGNCTSSSVAGAVFCNVNNELEGKIYISGNVQVYDNLYKCTKGSNLYVNSDGNASDISVSNVEAITCTAPVSGRMGIDFEGDGDGAFAKIYNPPAAECDAPFFSNLDSSLRARFHSGDDDYVYWEAFSTFNPGSSKAGSGLSYSFPNAAITVSSDSLSLSVLVDSGSFTVNFGLLPGAFSGYALCGDEYYVIGSASDFPSGSSFSALTLTAGWTSAQAQDFIRSLVFNPKAYGSAQKVSFGFADSKDTDGCLFGSSVYSFVEEYVDYYFARTAAVLAGGQLVSIHSETVNTLLCKIANSSFWSGAELFSDQWYFPDGTRFSASATSSEGFEGCFTAWRDVCPRQGDFCMVVSDDEKWESTGVGCNPYFIEKPAPFSSEVSTSISNPALRTRLNSYSLKLDGGIAVNYFFTFDQDYLSDTGAYVQIKVGSGEAVNYPVSDIAVETNRAAHNSDAYCLTVPVNAGDMNAETLIRFYRGDGSLLGWYGGSGNKNYNVRSYALKVIDRQTGGDAYNSGFSGDLVTLVKAMLNYGAAAESQFGTAGTTPANEGYVDDSGITESISGAFFENSNGSVSYALSLYAESDTRMRIAPQASGSFTALVDGAAVDSSKGYIDIPVCMQDLGHVFSISFSGAFEATLQINVLKVIQAILADSSASDAAKLTADRLYKMGLAADSYFGSYVPAANAMEAVLNTARAYLVKGAYVQYDQGRLTENEIPDHPNPRRILNASPEDATEAFNIYMDCSSFVYNVYREVFGAEAVQAALGLDESNMNTKNMIYGADNSGAYFTEAVRVAYFSCDAMSFTDFFRQLQPGDLIVKYDNSKTHGHVVLWTGDGYIHCTGSSYDYETGADNVEAKGAMYFVPVSGFNESFYEGFDDVVILRPLMVLGNDDIQSAGTARQQLGALSVSKTAAVDGKMIYSGTGVKPGDTVTFTITLSNPYVTGALNISRTVDISDTLPAGLTLNPGQSLSFSKVTVAPGATVTRSYTATVTAAAGSVIPATEGTCKSSVAGKAAGSISFSGLKFSVESAAVDTQAAAVVSSALSKVGSFISSEETDTTTYVYSVLQSIYSGATGSASALPGSNGDWVGGLFGQTQSGGYYYAYPRGSWKTLLVSNFASGRKVLNYSTGGGDFDTYTRMRELKTRNLMPGDLLCLYTPSLSVKYKYYIYTGDGTMVSFIEEKYCATVNAEDVLGNLFNKTGFAVLRIAGRA